MSKPTTQAVAFELRRIADALDKHPGIIIEQPMVSFYCNDYGSPDKGKAVFQNLARLLPHPLAKDYTETTFKLVNKTDAVWLQVQIDRANVCELESPAVPAKWRCAPLLSDEEEAALTECATA